MGAVALLLEHGLQVDVRNDVSLSFQTDLPNDPPLPRPSLELHSTVWQFGETPLFMAALAPDFEAPTEGHVEVVNLLLERQAEVNAKDCVSRALFLISANNSSPPPAPFHPPLPSPPPSLLLSLDSLIRFNMAAGLAPAQRSIYARCP